ncbi:MAG: response regulator [Planctomycetes bacterium]|nr:response regulator [Planctomycetota bacterium]
MSPMTLRTRLRALILATSIVALGLASGAFLAYDYYSFRRSTASRLQFLADLVAPQAAAALNGRDRRAASEALSRLSQAPHIVGAAVYADDGSLLARLLRPDAPDESVPRRAGPSGLRAEQGDYSFSRRLEADGRPLGTLYLRADLEEAATRLRLNASIVGFTLLVLVALSYVLSSRMVGSITRPIAGLAEIVNAVAARRDYSLRAEKRGPAELGVLIEGINDMFSQIQVRDGALTLARNELENRVKERTAELTFVNQELSSEISERKRVEAELRESEERYRQLVEFSPDAILILDGQRILFVNGAALRMFGARTQADLVGALFLERVTPEFSEIVLGRIRKVIQEHLSTPPLEERLLQIDGTPFDAEAQETPFIYLGRPAVQVVVRDISKRKEIERMKDEFVSAVSHELRTPLTSIQGSLGLVAGGVTGALSATAKPLIDIAYKNCGRLVLLINDILDSEKIAAGKMKFVLKEQELGPLLDQAIEANRGFGAQYGVRFELGKTVPGAKVEVDADRIIQVLTNLLSNAAKFSPSGEVITVSARRELGRIRVAVTDHGPGIPPEFRSRIFQKFSQADSSDRRAKGGTGLGLSISKAIAEKHSGSLSFVSEVGKGTTFVMDLPETGAPPPAPAAGPRALVCDDERQVADIIRIVLEREGIRVTTTENLAEAGRHLEQGGFQLLTMDFMLPDGNGVDFIRELRNSGKDRDLPILFISELAGSALTLGGAALGRVEYLDKPIDLSRLASAARAVLQGAIPLTEGAHP